jgi:hypothetical protein
MHAHIHTYIHTCMHAHIHTYIHSNIHTYIQTYIHTYKHACMHTYVHTYTHVHTYIHTYVIPNMCATETVVLGRIRLPTRINSCTPACPCATIRAHPPAHAQQFPSAHAHQFVQIRLSQLLPVSCAMFRWHNLEVTGIPAHISVGTLAHRHKRHTHTAELDYDAGVGRWATGAGPRGASGCGWRPSTYTPARHMPLVSNRASEPPIGANAEG